MDINAFFKKIEAEFVGGRVKAVVDGVHHWIAEFVDGNVVLTTIGKELINKAEAKAPHLAAQLENVPGAIGEIQEIVANPQAAVAAVAGPTAADAIDAAFTGLETAVAKKTTRTKKAAS